jgi:hypothetical protein
VPALRAAGTAEAMMAALSGQAAVAA